MISPMRKITQGKGVDGLAHPIPGSAASTLLLWKTCFWGPSHGTQPPCCEKVKSPGDPTCRGTLISQLAPTSTTSHVGESSWWIQSNPLVMDLVICHHHAGKNDYPAEPNRVPSRKPQNYEMRKWLSKASKLWGGLLHSGT